MHFCTSRIGASLVTLIVLGTATIAQAPAGPSGHWIGTIDVPNQALAIEIDLAPGTDGKWMGTITIPSQNLKGFPLSDIVVAGTAVSFALKGGPGDPRFKGTYAQDTRSLSGDYSQSGATMPFKLAWNGEAKFEPVAKSTPIGKELEGSWEGTLDAGGKTLRLVLKLANQSGVASGTLVSVDQGGAELTIDSIVQTGSRLAFTVRSVGGSYDGEVKDGQIVGTWTQGPGSLPLTFKPGAR